MTFTFSEVPSVPWLCFRPCCYLQLLQNCKSFPQGLCISTVYAYWFGTMNSLHSLLAHCKFHFYCKAACILSSLLLSLGQNSRLMAQCQQWKNYVYGKFMSMPLDSQLERKGQVQRTGPSSYIMQLRTVAKANTVVEKNLTKS